MRFPGMFHDVYCASDLRAWQLVRGKFLDGPIIVFDTLYIYICMFVEGPFDSILFEAIITVTCQFAYFSGFVNVLGLRMFRVICMLGNSPGMII